MPQSRRIGSAGVEAQYAAFRHKPMMIRCRDRDVDRAHRRPAASACGYQRLRSMLLMALLLLPLVAHAGPLITPATPLRGKAAAAAAPSDAASKGEAQAAGVAGEAADVKAADVKAADVKAADVKAADVKAAGSSRAVRPASPRQPHNVPGSGESAATPGLYLSRIEDRNQQPLRYRLAGILPDAFTLAESRARATFKSRATSEARANAQANAHAKPHEQADVQHPHVGGQRMTRPATATTRTAQSGDPCLRTHSGTLVIRTGQANSACSGVEFRAQMTRQLKAAMAEIDAGAVNAGSPVMATSMSKPSTAARHIMLTAPPLNMTLSARTPGEDTLRRLSSRANWAEQYQFRMTEVRLGQ
jgi:hypothetical protein